MTKKPSEWTPQEAWNECAKAHSVLWRAFWNTNETLPFPPDPVERVDDAQLQQYAEYGSHPAKLMALELIERRAKDKEQGR